MKKETLLSLPREEIYDFIRERLALSAPVQLPPVESSPFTKKHHRFGTSGPGTQAAINQLILSIFADIGIYDYTFYLYIDLHEGIPALYFQYPDEKENHMIELPGMDTVEIIYEIFRYTILSKKNSR